MGFEDSKEHDQNIVHAEFKEQLQRSAEGCYETGLPWRSNHSELPSNKSGSLRRLDGLTKKLQRCGMTEVYDNIIPDQVKAGIVEKALVNKEFYLPHKYVVKEKTETTKLRIVYLAPSLYLLEAVLESHFDAWAEKYPDEVARLRRSMYVDDLLTGGQTVQQVQTRKEEHRKYCTTPLSNYTSTLRLTISLV